MATYLLFFVFLNSSALCYHCLTFLPVFTLKFRFSVLDTWNCKCLTAGDTHTCTDTRSYSHHIITVCVNGLCCNFVNRNSSRSSVKYSRCDGKSSKIFKNILCFYIHSRTPRCSDQHQFMCDEPQAKTTNIKFIALHPNSMLSPFETRKFCKNQTPSSGFQKNICSPPMPAAAAAPCRAGEKKHSPGS